MNVRSKTKPLYQSWMLFLCALLLFGQLGIVAPQRVKATEPTGDPTAEMNFSGEGTGTIAEPFIITTREQLNEVRNHLDKHFRLGANISLSGSWEPIGELKYPEITEEDFNKPGFDPEQLIIDYTQGFTGSFDGAGYTISGLSIIETDSNGFNAVYGLFGFTKDAVIENVTLTNVSIQADSNIAVGGLVGKAMNTHIENSSVSGSVKGLNNVGGIVGSAEASLIEKTSSTSTVEGVDRVGGLIGEMEKETVVNNTYTTGSVKGENFLGGLVGSSDLSKIQNSYSMSTVNGRDVLGGLVGVAENTSVIEHSHATGAVTGNEAIGGLVGHATGNEKPETGSVPYKTSIIQSFSKGTIKGVNNVGGLIGLAESNTDIQNTYATGSVTEIEANQEELPPLDVVVGNEPGSEVEPEREPVGGAVGGLIGGFITSSLVNSYSIGLVKGIGTTYVGGLIGLASQGEATNTYYDVETSLQGQAIGTVEETMLLEVEGRSTEAMKNPLTYENWMFETIWVSNPNANEGYLFLRNQKEFSSFNHVEKMETPEERVARAKDNLTISGDVRNVTSDLALRTNQNGVAVSWTSDKTNWITNAGKVTRPAAGQANQTVKLTATLSFEGVTAKKEFTVIVVSMPMREKDVEILIDQRTRIGNISHGAGNAFLNFGSNSPGFTKTGHWESSLQNGTLIRPGDPGASATFTINVSQSPELRALASGGTADVILGWKELKFNKFGCFMFWCKTRVTDVSFIVDGRTVLSGRAGSRNVGPASRKVRIHENSRIEVRVWVEGRGAGADGMYIRFEDKVRPVLSNYTFTGNGLERTNPNTNQQELFVKSGENISLSYNFSKPVRPTGVNAAGGEISYDYFLRHPLFVNPAGTGLPAAGQQQYMRNQTYNKNNFTSYHRSVQYIYTGVKYHHSGNLPLEPKMGGTSVGAAIDLPMERKLNQAALADGAGNVVEISTLNRSSSNSRGHLANKMVNPFDYENGGYRVIVDAVAPKYSKTGNGIQPEILTNVVLNENDTIDFTLQLTEEAVLNKDLQDVTKTHLLFNNGMKAYYVSGSGTDKWEFRANISNAKNFETPLLKVVALTHDSKFGTPQQKDTNVLQDYAGNLLVQPANFDGKHAETPPSPPGYCLNVVVDKDTGVVQELTGKCDESLVNSKIDWANLSIDNTPPAIGYRYELGGANESTYQKNGKITVDATDPQIQVPGLDPVNPGSFRPSKGIYRPSNITGPQSPAAGLVYYVWSQDPNDPFASVAGDHFAAVKRYSLSAKQPGEDLYPGNKTVLTVANNTTNMLAPPQVALKPENSGEWYLHTWTADMTWDSARELMQYEKMKAFVQSNQAQYNSWKAEKKQQDPRASEADLVFYANNKALAAVGDYGNKDIWQLSDFKKKDSNWVYRKATILLDNQIPVVTFDEPENDNSANVKVTVHVNDPHSGVKEKNIRYQWVKQGKRPQAIDWSEVSYMTSVQHEMSIELSTFNNEMIDGDGNYDLHIEATDEAGNKAVIKMGKTVTVNSTVNMVIEFHPESNPNFVKSHDIVFRVLAGIDPKKVEYAFSDSMGLPLDEAYKVAEEKIDNIDELLARLTAETNEEVMHEEHIEVISDSEVEQEDSDSGTYEETSTNEVTPEENEEQGFFSSLFTTVANFVVSIFSFSSNNSVQTVEGTRTFMIPKDETKNGATYLHIRATGSDDQYYYFNKLYFFNNQGPGIYFDSNGVGFPKEAHEVTVTIIRPFSNNVPTQPLSLIGPEAVVETEPPHEELNGQEQAEGNENKTEAQEEVNSAEEMLEIEVNSNQIGEEVIEEDHINEETYSQIGTEEISSELSREEEINVKTLTSSRNEKYQWVRAVNGNFEVDPNGWKDLPEDGKVSIRNDESVFPKDEQGHFLTDEKIAEFKLFVWVVDELGNESEAQTSGSFKLFRPLEEDLSPPAESDFDLLYLYGDEQDGYTAIVQLVLKTEDKRGYEYSLSPDGGVSWQRWRPYTNFASIKVPTNNLEELNVKVKYRTGAGVISEKGKEVTLNTSTVSNTEPVYALSSLHTTRPVGEEGVNLQISTPLGIRVVPSNSNPTEPVRQPGSNTFNIKENGYYSFELTDIDDPERKATLYAVINNIDNTPPVGEFKYNVTWPTNGNVTVELNADKPVKVTNNNHKFTYTFTENGSFTFEFEDEAGNRGSATATVNNIDKEGPRVKIVRHYNNHKTIKDEQGNIAYASGVTLEVQKAEPTAKDFAVYDDRTKTLTENGFVSFVAYDTFGNVTVVKEKVDNLISALPNPETIHYTFVDENGNEQSVDKIVEIGGKSYSRGKVKVTISGKTSSDNLVFQGVAASKDDNGQYTNRISNADGEYMVSRTYGSEGTTTLAISDLLGNVKRVPVTIQGLDNTAPELALNKTTVAVLQNKADFDFQTDLGGFTVSDNVSLPEDIKVKITGLDLTTKGYQRVTYTATDQVGNVTTTYQDVYVVNNSGMLIFADDVLISAEAGLSALFADNTLKFTISRYNIMNVDGTDRVNQWGTFDVLYHSGLYREGQMKYIAKKITYEELINGDFEVTFPKAGWYTIIVRNQEREREYGTFFISKVN